MKQVFMNLILNAIQAMREGGSIFYIHTTHFEGRGWDTPGQFVQVEVRDTGLGIPAGELGSHLRSLFYQQGRG